MIRRMGTLAILVGLSCLAVGCALGSGAWPSDDEWTAFQAAGPIEPELDEERLLQSLPSVGAYRAMVGDLLEVQGARSFLGVGGDGGAVVDTVQTRVTPAGEIHLPLLGAVEVAGLLPAEIEERLATALHPRYLRERPALVVRITEPRSVPVAVFGAVEEPGLHELRVDRSTLYGALTAAGGILRASTTKVGARTIRIRKPGEARERALALPVKGLNVPFADVALAGGETIEVEPWEPALFTVVGLVAKPGAYEYPPGSHYNLMQALAIAGGIDRIASPPYATVFRKAEDGAIVACTFGISGNDLVRASAVEIRPGDVVAIEHTALSWTRSLVAQVLRLQVGFFVDSRT